MSYIKSPGDQDLFGKLIADGTQGKVDVPSHFNFSPRRLRVYLNGNRQFIQYGSIPEFRDDPDVFVLEPTANDTMYIKTAERVSYSVGYDFLTSFAFQTNQPLTSGDRIRFGPYTDQDGWFMEQRGADHTSSQVDIIERRGGSRNVLDSDVELPEPITVFNRYEIEWNWYNVGSQKWKVTFTNNGKQINDFVSETTNDTNRGPENANLPVRCEVTASSTTTGLELQSGSMAQILLGNTKNLVRTHPNDVTVTIPNGNDNVWVPVQALRLDPNDGNVNAQLQDLAFTKYANSTKVEIQAISVDPSKTDASGFSEPRLDRAVNSAYQTTKNVSTVPNDSGTVVTPSGSTKLGGFNISYVSARPAGNSFKDAGVTSIPTNEEIRRPVFQDDIIVFLVKTPSSDGQLSFAYLIDEDW